MTCLPKDNLPSNPIATSNNVHNPKTTKQKQSAVQSDPQPPTTSAIPPSTTSTCHSWPSASRETAVVSPVSGPKAMTPAPTPSRPWEGSPKSRSRKRPSYKSSNVTLTMRSAGMVYDGEVRRHGHHHRLAGASPQAHTPG